MPSGIVNGKRVLTRLWVIAACTFAASLPAADIEVDITQPGQLSAAVYESAGRMVRELSRALPVPGGQHTFHWDGLDMDGRPVPPGDYEWRSLQTQGLRSEYLMSVGTSVGDRWWPGNHGGPDALVVADDSLVVAAHPEGPPLLTRTSFEGGVVWERKNFEPARNPFDIAIGGGKVFYLQDNGKIFVLDFATGKPIGPGRHGTTLSAQVPVKTFGFGSDAAAGETTVPLAVFNADTGVGWSSIEGLTQTPGGVTCDAVTPRTFQATLPNGEYLLRFHYGDDAAATTLVEVHPNSLEPYPGHYTLPDKMAWWQLPPAAAGAEPKPIFLPQIYGVPRPVAVTDGRLSVTLIPESLRAQPTHAHWALRRIEVLGIADRIAADDEALLLSCRAAGLVLWLDPATGAVIDSAAVADVRDIALGSDQSVFALTGDAVVRLTRDDKQPETIIRGLETPVAFDVDPRDGGIVVAEGGSVQQVKQFSESGTLLATHGRKGGRQLGRYEPRDFSSLCGIAADGHGGFVVIEKNGVPRRTARLDRQGAPVREWFGGMDFYAQTSLDPADPTLGWLRQDAENLVQVKLDYARREWRPIAAYRWTSGFDPAGSSQTGDTLYANRLNYPPWFAGRVSSHQRMRTLRRDLDGDGTTELLVEFTTLPLLLVHDEKLDRLRPLACLGLMHRDLWAAGTAATEQQLPAAWAGAIRQAGGDPADAKARIKYAHYAWADDNGDGVIDADELRLGPAHRDASGATMPNGGFCVRIDEQLNAWIGPGATDLSGMYTIFKPERLTACGAPVWPLVPTVSGPKTAGRGQLKSVLPTAEGCFALLGGSGDGTKSSFTMDTAVHGWGWPCTMTDAMALLRLDAEGRQVWKSGPKAARWPHPRGQLQGAWHLGREVKGCVPVFDWTEQPCEFWTTDGLYVGGLFDGRDPHTGRDLSRPDSQPDPLYTWHGIKKKRIGGNRYFDECSLFAADDLRTGGDAAELPDGSVVFLGQGANNNPCYRITGWDGWLRKSGSIRVESPAAAASAAGTGLSAEVFSNRDLAGPPVVSRIDERLWFGIHKPWPEGTPAKDFSVRWTGFLEPRFTEDYCLSIYAVGEFRLWVDGHEVTWAPQDYPRDVEIRKGHSVPIPLRAGTRVPIRIEYRAVPMKPTAPHPGPSFHLNWESLSQPIEHVPTAALYPANNP